MSNRRTTSLKWLGIALIVAILLMVIAAGLGYWMYNGSYGGYGMMGGGGGGWWVVLMMGVPALVLIVILAVVLIGLGEPTPTADLARLPTALETLDARYARSGISREEYLRMRDDLTGGPGGRV